MQADAIASLPGQPAPRIAKRAADARLYTIDCSPLLKQLELLTGVVSAESAGLDVSAARTRQGLRVEMLIAGGSVPTSMPHKDYDVSVVVDTQRGRIAVQFEVRVYP